MKTFLYLNELCNISKTLSISLQPEKLLSQILSASLKASGADEGSLMLIDEESRTLRVKVGLGLPQDVYKKIAIRLGEPIAGIVAESGNPLRLDSQSINNLKISTPSGHKRRIKSSLSLPLKVMDKTIGVLNLNIIKDNKPFIQRDEDLLSVFATVAAISLEHAGLHFTTRQHIEEMTLLNKLGESLETSFSIEQIFELTAKSIEEVMELDILSFAFLEENHPRINVISHRPLTSAIKTQLKSEILKVLSDLTEISLFEDKSFFSIEMKKPLLKEPEGTIMSQVSLPLVANAKIIGIIRMDSFSINKFSKADIKFLSTMTSHVAIALENARMYKGGCKSYILASFRPFLQSLRQGTLILWVIQIG